MDIVDLLQDVQQIARRCPLPTLTRAYVRAARNFCTQTRWLRRELSAETIEGLDTVELILPTGDANLQIIGVRRVDMYDLNSPENTWEVRPSIQSQWRRGSRPGRPMSYAYVPEGDLAFYPTPNAELGVTVIAQVTPRRDATDLPDDLLTKWESGLVAGTLEYLLNIPGQSWSNPALAKTKYAVEFAAAINNARADEQRGYNTGTVTANIPARFAPRLATR